MDRELVPPLIPGTPECRIVANELNNIAVPWASLPSERLNKAPGNRSQPTPRMAQCDLGAARNFLLSRTAAQKRARKKMEKGRVGRRAEQRNAPTSLTVRELICVQTQGGSRDGCSG